MNTNPILLAVDLEHMRSAKQALGEALLQAKMRGAVLHICYVLPYGHYSYVQPLIPQQVLEDTADRARADLGKLVAEMDKDAKAPSIHILRGGVSQQVLLLATSIDAGQIIVNACCDDAEGNVTGPNAAQIGRYATCSVTILR